MSRTIIAVDIGGTNARFCLADAATAPVASAVAASGGTAGGAQLRGIFRCRVADHPGLADAWRAFAATVDGPLPTDAVIALAGPVDRTPIRLTNSPWVIDPAALKAELGLHRLTLINDFAAIAHGVTALPPGHERHLFGPERRPGAPGAITLLGPGTGLGVGLVLPPSRDGAAPRVVATEGGHIGFAPTDAEEDRLLGWLRVRFGRVSAERLVSGPGLNNLYQALAALDGEAAASVGDDVLWRQALSGENARAREALTRLVRAYGAVAGDLALAQGAGRVMLAGRLTGLLCALPLFAAFHEAFLAKGRHRDLMEAMPVGYADMPAFGLFGAAVAGLSAAG